MDEVRDGTVNVVLAWKIDRLARSLNHLAQINILAAVAQFERELIVERVKVGILAARQRGVKLGRPAKFENYIDAVRKLLGDRCGAADISRKLRIPYSTVTQLVREIRASS